MKLGHVPAQEKCGQTQRALCWDEQVETQQLTKCWSTDKDDSTVPSGLTF